MRPFVLSRVLRSTAILHASLSGCATEPGFTSEASALRLGSAPTPPSEPASDAGAPATPLPRSAAAQGNCEGDVTVEVGPDGTFGLEMVGTSREVNGPTGRSVRSCTVAVDFEAVPVGTTFVVESATVEVVGMPGVSADLTLAAFWPGDDDLVGLTAPVVIGDDGTATLAYRRSTERDTYPCANFPQIFVHTEMRLALDAAEGVAHPFGISAVRNIELGTRPCVASSW